MLIPNKKSPSSISALASYEEKAGSPGSTYVPVVSLEYSLPGPIGGSRLPAATHTISSQTIGSNRIRLPRQSRRVCHARNNITEDCTEAAHQIQGVGIQRHEHLKPIDVFSSSTPTVPLSSSELLYGGPDVTGRHGHAVGGDDGCGVELGTWGGDKQKLRELDLGNRRPTSRNSTSRKVASFDRVAFDRDREELRPIANSLPTSKQNPLRANGIKNNLLRADQNLNPRGRDEDLVAMGTLWSPSHLQTRSSITTSSSKSTSAANSAGGGGGAGGQYTTSTLTARRPINLSTTTSTRQQLYHTPNSTSTLTNPGMGNFVKGNKEVEPKYSDPLAGAPPTFQQRMMELAALEAETVRWERTKKVKKKPKQDRDS